MKRLIATLLFALVGPVLAQVSTAPPLLNYKGTTLPSTCQVGRLFFDTDATAGSNVYGCTSANTWTLQSGGGGSVAIGDVTGLGTGVATALAVNIGSAGAPVLFNGAGGTPSSLTCTNCTGTAAGLTAGTVTTNANLTGDVTSSGNATTLATVNSNVGSFTNSSITVNGKGLVTAASSGAAGAVLTANSFTAGQTITGSSASNTQLTLIAAAGVTEYAVRLKNSGGATQAYWGTTNNSDYYLSAGYQVSATQFVSASTVFTLGANGLILRDNAKVAWTNADANQAQDLFLSRSAAATLQQGDSNAASPVAQTLQAQGSRSGTDTNVGGANYTHASGQGTGTGTLSQFIINTPVAVASGTGAQTMTATLTLGNGVFTIGSNVVTPASSGTRYLCISTAGVVTSSASACSGT